LHPAGKAFTFYFAFLSGLSFTAPACISQNQPEGRRHVHCIPSIRLRFNGKSLSSFPARINL
jgi:hypothetical protein